MSNYFDKRTDFFKRYFEAALPYEEYVSTSDATHQGRWRAIEREVHLADNQQAITKTWKRKLNVLTLSGIWCGDCARQGPMLRLLEQANPVLSVRFIDNKQNPDLQEELRINGAEKVPVVVCLSEDFFEIQRFGDNHLSAYRSRAASTLGPACDPGIMLPSDDALSEELGEWVHYFDRIQLLLRISPMLRNRYND